ncbi:hypothetical protein WEB32_10145 [Streptomyces netropsis]
MADGRQGDDRALAAALVAPGAGAGLTYASPVRADGVGVGADGRCRRYFR